MIRRLLLAALAVLALAVGLTGCTTTGPNVRYAYGGVVFCAATVIEAEQRAEPAGHGGVSARWGSCDGAPAPTGLRVTVRTWWHPSNFYHVVCSETGWVGYPVDTAGLTVQAPSILAGCPDARPGDRFSTDVRTAVRLNFSDGSSYWRMDDDYMPGQWEEWTLP